MNTRDLTTFTDEELRGGDTKMNEVFAVKMVDAFDDGERDFGIGAVFATAALAKQYCEDCAQCSLNWERVEIVNSYYLRGTRPGDEYPAYDIEVHHVRYERVVLSK